MNAGAAARGLQFVGVACVGMWALAPVLTAVPGAYAFAADPIGYGVMGAVLMSSGAWLRLDALARDDRGESE